MMIERKSAVLSWGPIVLAVVAAAVVVRYSGPQTLAAYVLGVVAGFGVFGMLLRRWLLHVPRRGVAVVFVVVLTVALLISPSVLPKDAMRFLIAVVVSGMIFAMRWSRP